MNKTEHPLYSTWIEMKRRCNNKKTISYNRYGGRGIKVCKRWNVDFKSFVKSIGDKPTKSHSLDRIDNNGDYKPNNCKWSTHAEQNRNRRDNIIYKGECAVDASVRLGGNKHLIAVRIHQGWSLKRAFTTLPQKRPK